MSWSREDIISGLVASRIVVQSLSPVHRIILGGLADKHAPSLRPIVVAISLESNFSSLRGPALRKVGWTPDGLLESLEHALVARATLAGQQKRGAAESQSLFAPLDCAAPGAAQSSGAKRQRRQAGGTGQKRSSSPPNGEVVGSEGDVVGGAGNSVKLKDGVLLERTRYFNGQNPLNGWGVNVHKKTSLRLFQNAADALVAALVGVSFSLVAIRLEADKTDATVRRDLKWAADARQTKHTSDRAAHLVTFVGYIFVLLGMTSAEDGRPAGTWSKLWLPVLCFLMPTIGELVEAYKQRDGPLEVAEQCWFQIGEVVERLLANITWRVIVYLVVDGAGENRSAFWLLRRRCRSFRRKVLCWLLLCIQHQAATANKEATHCFLSLFKIDCLAYSKRMFIQIGLHKQSQARVHRVLESHVRPKIRFLHEHAHVRCGPGWGVLRKLMVFLGVEGELVEATRHWQVIGGLLYLDDDAWLEEVYAKGDAGGGGAVRAMSTEEAKKKMLAETMDLLHTIYARADSPAFNKWLTAHRAAVDLTLQCTFCYDVVAKDFTRSAKLHLGKGDFLTEVPAFFREQTLFNTCNIAFGIFGVPTDRLQRRILQNGGSGPRPTTTSLEQKFRDDSAFAADGLQHEVFQKFRELLEPAQSAGGDAVEDEERAAAEREAANEAADSGYVALFKQLAICSFRVFRPSSADAFVERWMAVPEGEKSAFLKEELFDKYASPPLKHIYSMPGDAVLYDLCEDLLAVSEERRVLEMDRIAVSRCAQAGHTQEDETAHRHLVAATRAEGGQGGHKGCPTASSSFMRQFYNSNKKHAAEDLAKIRASEEEAKKAASVDEDGLSPVEQKIRKLTKGRMYEGQTFFRTFWSRKNPTMLGETNMLKGARAARAWGKLLRHQKDYWDGVAARARSKEIQRLRAEAVETAHGGAVVVSGGGGGSAPKPLRAEVGGVIAGRRSKRLPRPLLEKRVAELNDKYYKTLRREVVEKWDDAEDGERSVIDCATEWATLCDRTRSQPGEEKPEFLKAAETNLSAQHAVW